MIHGIMKPEVIALTISIVNSIVGVGLFIIHCRGDKRRDWEIRNKIDKLL